MKKINEGQTQVYMNGMITPQYGVNNTPPPPRQLLDIITGLKTGTPKSDAQLLAILVGMGTNQKMAEQAILFHNTMNQPQIEENQKNHNKMTFTLSSLYEQVNLCINQLKEIKSDRSRVSYTTQSALSILESTLNSFPMRFTTDGVSDVVSEEVENTVNPSLKFGIASKLHKQLSVASWVNPVKQLREFIENSYAENKFLFRVSQSVQNKRQQRGKMY